MYHHRWSGNNLPPLGYADDALYLVKICGIVFRCYARITSPRTLNSKASVKVLKSLPNGTGSAFVTYFALSMSSNSKRTAHSRRHCWASRLQVVVHLGDAGGFFPIPSGWDPAIKLKRFLRHLLGGFQPVIESPNHNIELTRRIPFQMQCHIESWRPMECLSIEAVRSRIISNSSRRSSVWHPVLWSQSAGVIQPRQLLHAKPALYLKFVSKTLNSTSGIDATSQILRVFRYSGC